MSASSRIKVALEIVKFDITLLGSNAVQKIFLSTFPVCIKLTENLKKLMQYSIQQPKTSMSVSLVKSIGMDPVYLLQVGPHSL